MMADKKGHSNAQSLFGVHQLPCDEQIRDLLVTGKPDCEFPVFEKILQMLEQKHQFIVFPLLG
jgi:hypothetical protein